ncbi:hypothetical protein SCOCK_180134 [Actinacidiphila cocklensis]|uniref:Uncharacterized protein n=1 Tax=Actinacidiphila cocklensis TaxID=887465 RepID=A0A9W4GPZ2_9ACTN|nr:hypothetical protein SCOCK_180134 [Actinacidiphila cocklensis]
MKTRPLVALSVAVLVFLCKYLLHGYT